MANKMDDFTIQKENHRLGLKYSIQAESGVKSGEYAILVPYLQET